MGLTEKKRKKYRAVIFILLIVCWMPYAVMTFPGNMAYDAGTGIAWYLDLDRSNPNNPYFQNYLMGLTYEAGRLLGNANMAVFAYCLVQMLLTALLLSRFAVRITERTGGKAAAAVPALALYCLLPAFPMYSFTFCKDSNFALAVLYLVYLSYEALEDPGEYFRRTGNIVRFSIAVLLVSVLRNHTWVIASAAFAGVALFAARNRRVIAAAAATCLCAAFLSVGLPAAAGIEKTETKESLSLPLQTTAYYVLSHGDSVTEKEKETISRAVDYEALLLYDPWIADPIKDRASFSDDTAGAFLSVWTGMIGKQPGTMLTGFWNSVSNYIDPNGFQTVKPHIIAGYEIRKDYRETLGLRNENPMLDTAREADRTALNLPVLGILAKTGIYSWLLAAVTALMLLCRRPRYLLCTVPLWMVFLGCLLSPVNGYYRYAYPLVLSTPLLLTDAVCHTARTGFGKSVSARIRRAGSRFRAGNKALRICAAVLLPMALSLLLDAAVWYAADGKAEAAQTGEKTVLSDAIPIRCTFENGNYIPTAEDPHLVYPVPGLEIRSAVIRLAEPLENDTDVQAYFMAENEPANERRSVSDTAPAGAERIVFNFRMNRSVYIRFDLDGEMAIESITLSDRETERKPAPYEIRWIRVVPVWFAAAAWILIRTRRNTVIHSADADGSTDKEREL